MTSARKRKKQVYRAMGRVLAQRLLLVRLLRRFVRRKLVLPVVRALLAGSAPGSFFSGSGVVGGLYTRGGDDVQRLSQLSSCGLSGEFECIKAPAAGWCAIGDREWNLLRRYARVGD
jgi:hypothetical protein